MSFLLSYRLPFAALCVACVAPTVVAHGVQRQSLWFVDAAESAGIEFSHQTGARGPHHLPETMGAGVAWVDYDNDGRHDLYFVQSGNLPDRAREIVAVWPGNEMYRNLGDGSFARVASGAEDDLYGMGVTAADYDNDGWADIFVSNLGPNTLYRNNGDGTFSRNPSAGVGDERWATSAAWGDLDSDGFVDLFVANYVAYDLATTASCGDPPDGFAYCHINLFDGLPDLLYRNDGDGTFTELGVSAGVANALEGKGLGVVLADLTNDGRTDIYVANDTQQNFMYVNQGEWRFEDQGLFSGTGYNDAGKAQAGMGTETADFDGDGNPEILVTNFAYEANNLYRQIAPGMFLDDTATLGLGEPGFAPLSFGIVAFDADGDGDREIAVANGHIQDNIVGKVDGAEYEQRNHLFTNLLVERRAAALADGTLTLQDGARDPVAWRPETGLFEEVGESSGPSFSQLDVTRGLAVGDGDGDGRPDLALVNSGAPARLLLNRSDTDNHRLVIRLRGRRSNRDALGAQVVVTPLAGLIADGSTGFPQYVEVRSASSYCSQGSTDLHFGLGSSATARVQIRWPDGDTQLLDGVDADQIVLLFEGADDVVRRPLGRTR